MKTILCCKVTPENKDFLKKLSIEKNRSVSSLIDITITDMLKHYNKYESVNENTR